MLFTFFQMLTSPNIYMEFFRVLFYLFPMDLLYMSFLSTILTTKILNILKVFYILITTVIASSIEVTRFTFAYLFCIPMNKKLLQSVDLHKQKLYSKEKIFENNILIYFFILKNCVELAYAGQQIAKVFYSFWGQKNFFFLGQHRIPIYVDFYFWGHKNYFFWAAPGHCDSRFLHIFIHNIFNVFGTWHIVISNYIILLNIQGFSNRHIHMWIILNLSLIVTRKI